MPRVPDTVIQEIRDRVNIRALVEEYVKLKKDGSGFKGLCPFHAEKTPSFRVNEGRQFFHCFGCGEHGDVFGFMMKIENMSFPEALERLAGRAGVELPKVEEKPEEKARREKSEIVFQANEAAAAFYQQQLQRSPAAEIAREYLKKRGMDAETTGRRRLGFSPPGWTDTMEALKRAGIREEDQLEAGLLIRNEEKNSVYDRFRGRLMFPIVDMQKRVRGFGARILGAEEGQPKYINSPETPVFHKGSGFYGLDSARDHIRKTGRILIVEGYFDQITLDQHGVGYTVATLGTALTADHAAAIRRMQAQPFLVFDADEAGRKASMRALEIFLEAGIMPKMVLIPEGDPDDFVRARGREGLEQLLEAAPALLSWQIDAWLKEAGTGPTELAAAVNRAAEMVARVQDPVERSLYATELSRRSGVAFPQVEPKIRRPERKSEEEKKAATAPLPTAELDLIRLLIHHPEWCGRARENQAAALFSHPGLAQVLSRLLAQEEATGRVQAGTLLDEISDPALTDRVSRVIFEKDPFEGIGERAVEDIIRKLKHESIIGRIRALSRELREAQASGDQARCRTILEMQQALETERREINSSRGG